MWNDAYFTIVDDYLKRYNALTVRKNNLESEMAEIEEVLNQLPVAKTTKYGWSGGRDGTWEKPSPQEAYCDEKEREEKRLANKRIEYAHVCSLLERIDRSVEALPKWQQEIVKSRVMERLSWQSVALKMGDGGNVGRVRSEYRKAMINLADMILPG